MKARTDTSFVSTSALLVAAAVFVATTGLVTVTANAESIEQPASDRTPVAADQPSRLVATTGTLSEEEAEGIIFMREEEKLARDVYLTLAEIWDVPAFSNIAASEQQHMDAILRLIDTYGLEDTPYAGTVGVYDNAELQAMYDELVTRGSGSLEAAFEVGATIEEVDIVDIEEYLAESTASDISRVYENLLRGSRNHLRAFVSQLEAAGVDRVPYLLDEEIYESILASDTEQGSRNGRSRGPAAGTHQRSGGGRNGDRGRN